MMISFSRCVCVYAHLSQTRVSMWFISCVLNRHGIWWKRWLLLIFIIISYPLYLFTILMVNLFFFLIKFSFLHAIMSIRGETLLWQMVSAWKNACTNVCTSNLKIWARNWIFPKAANAQWKATSGKRRAHSQQLCLCASNKIVAHSQKNMI